MDPARSWMRLAVDAAKLSVPEPRLDPPPRVGVVVARGEQLIGQSHRGATGPGDHAEYGLLKQLEDVDLTGAEIYTTLEPCSRRNHPKRPCATRIAERGISTVYIGLYDPNPQIHREGWRILRDAGLQLRDFDPDLRAEAAADNAAFLDGFRVSTAAEDEKSFQYGPGRTFEVTVKDHVLQTQWAPHGPESVWAVDNQHNVALAYNATEFEEIHDPSALTFAAYTQSVSVGEIVVFRDDFRGYLLVKVIDVVRERSELRIRWQMRTPRSHQHVV